jgi:hypothetical protein
VERAAPPSSLQLYEIPIQPKHSTARRPCVAQAADWIGMKDDRKCGARPAHFEVERALHRSNAAPAQHQVLARHIRHPDRMHRNMN